MSFKVIVAVDDEMGIAANGKIPWKIPEDLKHFQNTTTACLDPMKKILDFAAEISPFAWAIEHHRHQRPIIHGSSNHM